MDEPGTDLKPLFDAILKYVPCPEGDPDEPLQLLGEVDEDLRQAIGVGVVGISNGYTIFGYKNRDWKEWTLHNGLKMMVSEEFRTRTDDLGNTCHRIDHMVRPATTEKQLGGHNALW